MRESVSRNALCVVVASVALAPWACSKRPSAGRLPSGLVECGAKIIREKDGAEMVRIPAGEFTMGSEEYESEKPVHKVYLDEYYIDKFEVTVAQFRKFCKETGHSVPKTESWSRSKDNHPVVNVSWEDAAAYAKWAGASLPTEAQWEKAARGTDGQKYPWGNDWDRHKCNSASHWAKKDLMDITAWSEWKKGGGLKTAHTTSVGTFPSGVSPYGCMDMAGNVFEWCADWYDEAYYAKSPNRNPTGPSSGKCRVLRGGSWGIFTGGLRSSFRTRSAPAVRGGNGGFRCSRAPSLTENEPAPVRPSVGRLPLGLVERDGKIIRVKDGAKMVRIAAGKFAMGSEHGRHWEKPVHKVYLDEYYMDKFEVTVAQFRKFCRETGHSMPKEESWSKENHPVVLVSWEAAAAYAKWAGASLPTEAQWEKAARGTDGRKYPWGNEEPNGTQCNYADKRTSYSHSDKAHDDGYEHTAPVGTYPNGASPYGCMDMAGNVWEWCADWYDEAYYAESPNRNPAGPSSGQYRVLRGGSWNSSAGSIRACNRVRLPPSLGCSHLGFRCSMAP